VTVPVGIYIPQVGVPYSLLLERAGWLEELGFDSMWLMDHLSLGADTPRPLEAWTTATALLASTERLRVGHLVLCNNFRHPAVLAQAAATLHEISGGRFVFGLGSGSIEQEHHDVGLPWGSFRARTDRLATTLATVTAAFQADGGRPPILVGGGGASTLALAARYADIWNCSTYDLPRVAEKIDGLRAACAAIGRDAGEIVLSVEAVLAIGADDAAAALALERAERHYGGEGFGLHAGRFAGTPPAIVDRIHELRALGVDHFVFFTHDRASRPTLELLAEHVLPALA
jgi:alkanesulfonate monooxygenase SsuD/methylene tetrahydromethanopterin reductase-like flavin-dependent oxidoreductase (luciferase family)